MNYFVYILFSEKLNKFYVGTTDDVEKRLTQHNKSFYDSSFTQKGIPWTLFLSIMSGTSNQAYELERFIKRMKSAAFIRKLKDDSRMVASILQKISQK